MSKNRRDRLGYYNDKYYNRDYDDSVLPSWLVGIKTFCNSKYDEELFELKLKVAEIQGKKDNSANEEEMVSLAAQLNEVHDKMWDVWEKYEPLHIMLKEMEENWCLENMKTTSDTVFRQVLTTWLSQDKYASKETLKYLESANKVDDFTTQYDGLTQRFNSIADAFVEFIKHFPAAYSGYVGYSGTSGYSGVATPIQVIGVAGSGGAGGAGSAGVEVSTGVCGTNVAGHDVARTT